jgi:hypothetical protein
MRENGDGKTTVRQVVESYLQRCPILLEEVDAYLDIR